LIRAALQYDWVVYLGVAMAAILVALFSAIKDVRVLILTAIRVVFSEAAARDCVASIKRWGSRDSFRAG
jgi:hypothetical protein